jgi:hypothetical protein
MAGKTTLEALLDLVGTFVVAQNGTWEHEQWETLLLTAGKLGIVVDDESKRNLGNILESCKYFFGNGCTCEPTKTAVKKPAAKAKAKAKPKSK